MTHTYTHLSAHTCIQAGDREGSERGERGECETPRRRDRHTAPQKRRLSPNPLLGSLRSFAPEKERNPRQLRRHWGEEKRAQPEWAHSLPPTSTLPGTSGTSGHPDPRAYRTSAPPRTQPARTFSPAARGGAERTVQEQQAGQPRAERSHVAVGRAGAEPRALGCKRGWGAIGAPAGLRLLRRRRLPPRSLLPPDPGPLRGAAAWTAGSRRPRLPAGERSDRRASVPSANCRRVGPPAPRRSGTAREPGEGTTGRAGGGHTGGAGPGAGRSRGRRAPVGGAQGADRKCHAEPELGLRAPWEPVPSASLAPPE